MQLVSLSSAAKDSLITGVAANGGYQRSAFWTSGALTSWPSNNNPSQAVFTWADSLTFSYSNWCFGQPNNQNGGEEYVVTYNGCWYDTQGVNQQNFICEEVDDVSGYQTVRDSGIDLSKK